MFSRLGSPAAGLWRRLHVSSYNRWVFYYLSAVLSAVIVVSAVASYLVVEKDLMGVIEDRVRRELRRTADGFSAMIVTSIIPAAQQVYETQSINRLIYGARLADREVLEASQLLDRFKLANPLVDSILVYNHQADLMYSTRRGVSSAREPEYGDLLGYFKEIKKHRLFRLLPRRVGEANLLTVIVGTPPIEGSSLLGALIVNVSESSLRTLFLNKPESGKSSLTVVDDRGIVLSDPDPSRFGGEARRDAMYLRAFTLTSREEASEGAFLMEYEGKSHYVSFYREPTCGWTFISTTSGDDLFSVLSRWRNRVVLVFGLIFLLSLGLAFSTSRKVSLPVNRLLLQAQQLQAEFSEHFAPDNDRNEIALVAETMQLLNQRLRTLDTLTALGDEYEKKRGLASLFQGQELDPKERSLLVREGLEDPTKCITAAACMIDRLEDLGERLGPAFVHERMKDLIHGLEGVSAPRVLAVEIQKGLLGALVIRDFKDETDLPAVFQDLLQGLRHGGATQVTFTVGLGDPVQGLDHVSSSFDSALEAVRHRFRYGPGTIIPASKLRKENAQSYVLPDEELRRFTEHARLLDRRLVESILSELLREVRDYGYGDFLFLSQNILYTLERLFIESGVMNRRLLAEFRERHVSLTWIETPEDLSAYVDTWYRRFLDLSSGGSAQKLSSLVADMKKIIQDSLVDPELSTKSVASRMKLSVNYVRSVFKSATGESISAYVTRLRIERCRELLQTRDLPVKEVHLAAGFTNYNYFFTLFRKQTGQTRPGIQAPNCHKVMLFTVPRDAIRSLRFFSEFTWPRSPQRMKHIPSGKRRFHENPEYEKICGSPAAHGRGSASGLRGRKQGKCSRGFGARHHHLPHVGGSDL